MTATTTTNQPANMREAIARAVHCGRFPADRVPSPFEMEDARGKEYCFRIADAILARLFPDRGQAMSTPDDGGRADAVLLADANSWYSAAQLDEMEHTRTEAVKAFDWLDWTRREGPYPGLGAIDKATAKVRAALSATPSTPGVREALEKIERRAIEGSAWNKNGGNTHNYFAEIIQAARTALSALSKEQGR